MGWLCLKCLKVLFADGIVAHTAASNLTLHSQCTVRFVLLFLRSFVFYSCVKICL